MTGNVETPTNAVFIWIPKTAGTSLFAALQNDAYFTKYKRLHDLCNGFRQTGRVTFGHMDYVSLNNQNYVNTSYFAQAFKFSFVRDPYARTVSLFLYLKKEGRIKNTATFLEFCRLLDGGAVEPIGLYNSKGLSQCNPQMTWLRGIDLDYLGRYEDLENSYRFLADKFRIPVTTLPHLNSSNGSNFIEYYCPKSKAIVETYYAEDFESLGYSYLPQQ